MALIDIWKTSPEQLVKKSIQQILSFAGDGRLRENNATAMEFREFLGHVPSELLTAYATQCLELKAFGDSGLALQEIANQVGRRLGFQIEHGRYRGSSDSIGFDGLWTSKQGEAIIVEVKTTDAYRLSLDTAATYRKRLVSEGKIDESKSSILYVVGRADTGDLEAQVRGSRHAWDIRLISVDALLRLLKLKEELEDPETVEKIRDILMPREFTRVDGIIDLVFSAKKETIAESIDAEPESDDPKKEKKFTPVKFRMKCIERLQHHFRESLVRQTSAIYATPDESRGIYCGTSREYERSNGTGYWFGFHPAQKQTLETFDEGWVSFGCGSEKQILLIPLPEFATWLERFNKTEREEGGFYWHVHVGIRNGKWTVDAKTGYEPIDVTAFVLRPEGGGK